MNPSRLVAIAVIAVVMVSLFGSQAIASVSVVRVGPFSVTIGRHGGHVARHSKKRPARGVSSGPPASKDPFAGSVSAPTGYAKPVFDK